MIKIKKEDLHYSDYSWTAIKGDNPKVSGEPDSSLLNRKEGYEILYFLNKFMQKHNLKQKESSVKAEKMIRNKVPSSVRSQIKVMEWIENNWNN